MITCCPSLRGLSSSAVLVSSLMPTLMATRFGRPSPPTSQTVAEALDDAAWFASWRVGLADRGHHWPNQLSGGEQQRVVIARAVVNEPALILADEPTGALDTHTSDEILSLFEGIHREGRTIIVVTHAAEVADRARRQITLQDGQVIKDDGVSARSLVRRCDLGIVGI